MRKVAPYNGQNPVEYNGKIYRINGLYNGLSYNLCEADFLYKGKWYGVKNTQTLIDLRKYIDKQNTRAGGG